MNLVVKIENNIMITSKMFSDVVKCQHKTLLRKMREEINKNPSLKYEFIKSTYEDFYNREKPMFEITENGLKHLIKTTKNITPEMIQQLGVSDIDVVYSNTRFEIAFGEMLSEALAEIGLTVEKQFNVDGYRVDFYISEVNVCVEYDEAQHFVEINTKKDEERQSYIENKLGCKFIRCDYRNSDIKNVMKVLKEVM